MPWMIDINELKHECSDNIRLLPTKDSPTLFHIEELLENTFKN